MNLRIKTGAIVVAMSIIAPFLIGTLNYGMSLEGYETSNFLSSFAIMLFAFYAVFYYANINAHEGSIARDGDKYLKTLAKQLEEQGLVRLILKRWFVKYFEQKGEYSKNPLDPQ